MLLEGCQGKKGPQIREVTCPQCGSPVELMSTDVSAECEECGFTVYSDLMDCVFRCSMAKECVGEAQYARMLAAKADWQNQQEQLLDNDQW